MLSIQTASILGKQRESAVKIGPLGSGGTQREMSYMAGAGVEKRGVCVFEGCFKTVEMRDMKPYVDFSELFLLFLLLSSYIFSKAWMRESEISTR